MKTSNDRDLRMFSGKNSKTAEETKTIFVPIKAQFSCYYTKKQWHETHTEESGFECLEQHSMPQFKSMAWSQIVWAIILTG